MLRTQIDTAAHINHMDDMLGAMLDLDDTVRLIKDWIVTNSSWDDTALYVTADHDHYLTLLPQFPEMLASLLISGESHNIVPEGKLSEQTNPWGIAVKNDRHKQTTPNKTQIDHLKDFSTWAPEDILKVGHFWGPKGSGGNGWGSHSSRPVPVSFQGDGGCIARLQGKGYRVLGREVKGVPDKIDQVHLHACMMKNLFGF
jgi:alkaline phosphatase